jgi:hypothetical protein
MSNRKLLVLSVVFLALLSFVVFFERHQPNSEEAAKARKRLVDFKSDEVTSIAIERPDLPKLDLSKGASGRWTLAGAVAGPADAVTADALVSDLARLEVIGEVKENVDPKEFGLDAPKATATVGLKDGRKLVLKFGREIPGTDAVAAAEEKRVAAVKYAPMASLAKPVDEFRSKSLLEIPASEVTQISVVKGPNRVVLLREVEGENRSDWRIEAPTKDLAAQGFVEQLLSDIAAARISEFPALPAGDLARVGLNPAAAVVTLQKGAEVVSSLSFGAAKAETTGKIYAKREGLVVVVDDRVLENLSKEFSAFRENRLCPVDSWAAVRVTYESGDVRAGAERVGGEWRSGGKTIGAALAEDLVDRISRAEAKGFVGRKDWAAHGIAVGTPKGKVAAPLARVEILKEKQKDPAVVSFYAAAPLGTTPVVAAEVTGRADALLVEKSVLDDVRQLAQKLKSAPSETPTPVPPAKRAKDAPKSATKVPATGVEAPPKGPEAPK